jgi:large subunit ribosomal protein L25
MDKLILSAESRTVTGRKVKNLRKDGLLPANVFGKKVKSQAVSIKLSDFSDIYKKAGETSLISLQIGSSKGQPARHASQPAGKTVLGDQDAGVAGGDDRAVLVSNIQMDPISGLPLHVDFHQVDLKEKVTAKVPVEVIGESPAEKQSVGTVVTYINDIEVEALPADLPDKFTVDISELAEVGQAVHVKDLKFDRKKVEVKVDLESIVLKVEPPQKEEVVEVAPAAVEAVGPEGAVKPEGEGESAAEGEKPQAKEEKAAEEKK